MQNIAHGIAVVIPAAIPLIRARVTLGDASCPTADRDAAARRLLEIGTPKDHARVEEYLARCVAGGR